VAISEQKESPVESKMSENVYRAVEDGLIERFTKSPAVSNKNSAEIRPNA
jgi:hypothetical protein